jgi:hypothetical protein
MWGRALSLISAVALITATPAFGDSFGPPGAFDLAVSPATLWPMDGYAMAGARRIAVGYWGVDPCGGSVTLTWEIQAPTVNALSSWRNPDAAYGNPQQNTACSVAFNSLQGFDWPMLCTVFVHEFGHLAGHAHVIDPTNVMSPIYLQPISQCQTPPTPPTPPAAAAATAPAQTRQQPVRGHKKAHKKAQKKTRRNAHKKARKRR